MEYTAVFICDFQKNLQQAEKQKLRLVDIIRICVEERYKHMNLLTCKTLNESQIFIGSLSLTLITVNLWTVGWTKSEVLRFQLELSAWNCNFLFEHFQCTFYWQIKFVQMTTTESGFIVSMHGYLNFWGNVRQLLVCQWRTLLCTNSRQHSFMTKDLWT